MQTFISDTSFLFSIFGNDTHTLTARAWIRQYQRPISVSVLNYYEFQNAIRFAAFRKAISRTEAVATLDAFESDLKSGHLQSTSVDFGAVFAEASNLSANYTLGMDQAVPEADFGERAQLLRISKCDPFCGISK